jgi:hypothetical protein
MKFNERRLAVALRWMLKSDPEDKPAAIKNAKKVLESIDQLEGFIPTAEGSSIDDDLGFITRGSSGQICDYYHDGIWQQGLIAIVKKQAVLSREDNQS